VAQIRQVWRTNSPNEAIVISICPGYYFGLGYNNFKLDVKWDPSSNVESFTSSDPNQLVILTHSFPTPGDHEIYMIGGWSDNPNYQIQHGRRKLAYPIEADRDGGETIDRLIRWRYFRKAGETRSTRLQKWQLDDDGDPIPGEVGAELAMAAEFYLAGRGTFKGYANMGNWPSNVKPIYSTAPATRIELSDDPGVSVDMSECFMNCGELEGRNLWSFRAWEERNNPGAGKISNMVRCFKNAIKPILTDYKRATTIGRVVENQTVTLPDGTTTTVKVVTDPGVTTWHDVKGTEQTRGVFNIWAWGVSTCEDFTECFADAGIRFLDLSRWQMSSAKILDHMFRGLNLERLILGRNGAFGLQWDISNVVSMKGTFQDCDTEDLLLFRASSHRDYGKTLSELRKTDGWLLKDFSILNAKNVTDFTDCFKDSNINVDISQWDVDNAVEFDDFRTGGDLVDEHLPDFTFPQADIEIVDFYGDQNDQYVEVAMAHTGRWAWKVNDNLGVDEPVATTSVKLEGMRYGLNTLALSAWDVEDNLDEEEFNYVLALTSVDTQIDTSSCPSVVVEDLSANGQTLEIDVSLHNAESWQYSVSSTHIQNVTVSELSASINGLPFGTNVILLSALDVNGDLLSESKAVVILGTGASGGGAGGGSGSGATGGTIWFNPDDKPAPSPGDVTAELAVASTYVIAYVSPDNITASITLPFLEQINVQQINALAYPEGADLSLETKTAEEIINPSEVINTRVIAAGACVEDLAGTTGSLALSEATGLVYDQMNVHQISIRSNVNTDDGNTGSNTLGQSIGVLDQMFIRELVTRASTRENNTDPIQPYPYSTIWDGITDVSSVTQSEFESTIQPKIQSYLEALA